MRTIQGVITSIKQQNIPQIFHLQASIPLYLFLAMFASAAVQG